MNKSLSLSIITVALATAVSGSAAFTPEQRLSENTVLLVSVKDFPASIESFKTAPNGGALLCSEAMAPFWGKVNSLIAKTVTNGEVIDCNSYMDIVTGGITFAITQPKVTSGEDNEDEDDGTIVSVLALVAAEVQTGEKLDAKLAKLKEKLPPSDVETCTISGTDFTLVHANRQEMLYGVKDNLFVVACDLDSSYDKKRIVSEVENILAEKRSDKTLGESDIFKKNTLLAQADDYFFLNFVPITDIARQFFEEVDKKYQAPENPMEAMMAPPRPMVVYNALGLNAFKSLAFTSKVVDGVSYTDGLFLCPQDERQGLSALINAISEGDCSPISLADEDVSSFNRSYINFNQLWNTIDSTTTTAMGPLKMLLTRMFAEQLKEADINLKEVILDNLTGETVSITKLDVADASSLNVKVVNNLVEFGSQAILLGAQDPEKLITALAEKVIPLCGGYQLECKEVAGTKTYYWDGGKGIGYLFPLSTTNGKYVAITDNEKTVEMLVSRVKAEDGLPNVKKIAESAAKVGGYQQGSFGYQGFGAVSAVILAAAKAVTAVVEVEDLDMEESARDLLKALPSYDQIKGLIGYSVGTTKLTQDGIVFKSITTK